MTERPDAAPPPSDAAPVAPSDEAKLAFVKAHAAVMGEWEVTDGWEKALDAGLRAAYAVDAHPEDARGFDVLALKRTVHEALECDGYHHVRWHLEQLADLLGVPIAERRGIAP